MKSEKAVKERLAHFKKQLKYEQKLLKTDAGWLAEFEQVQGIIKALEWVLE
jgi:hypothetical protein